MQIREGLGLGNVSHTHSFLELLDSLLWAIFEQRFAISCTYEETVLTAAA